MRDKLIGLLVAVLGICLAAGSVGPAEAKFRDALNFEDNQFVNISKLIVEQDANISSLEGFHRIRAISGSDNGRPDGTFLDYQLTSGVMSFFEVGVNFPVRFYDNGTQGNGDISIFQRFKFQEATEGLPASSGGIELIFPTGDENSNPPTGTDNFNARLFGSLEHSLDENWIWLANGGVTFFGGDQYENRLEYNGALRYQPSSQLKLMVEALGQSGGFRDQSEFYLAPGANLKTESDFSIMVTVPVGLTDDSPDFKPSLQFAHEF
ncbi:MAG: hypothetical protein ABEK50_03600 [bacterium]